MQKMVFAFTGKPIIQNAYEGFNCCIFAYGQTGNCCPKPLSSGFDLWF